MKQSTFQSLMPKRLAFSTKLNRMRAVIAALFIAAFPIACLDADVNYTFEEQTEVATQSRPDTTLTSNDTQHFSETTETLQSISRLGELESPEQAMSSLKLFAMVTLLSTAPAMLLMTTSFLRISIVLSLLRQALGTQQNPSNQVIAALALFMSALVMAPTWNTVYYEAIVPYSNQEITGNQAWDISRASLVTFMGTQIDNTGNTDDVWLFYDYLPQPEAENQPSYMAANSSAQTPTSYHQIPLQALLPAFMIIASVYIMFFDKSAAGVKGFKIFKSVLSILIFAAAVYFIWPSEKISPDWQEYSDDAYQSALDNNQKIMIDFYADWCIPCKELDALTFSDERVIEKSKEFVSFKVDMTKTMSERTEQIRNKFKILGMPTVLLIDSKGNEIERLTGFVNADEFLKLMNAVK